MLKTMTRVSVLQKSCNYSCIQTIKSVFGRVLFGMLLILVCSLEARAQFIVQPMEISLQGRAGSLIRTSFKLENRARFESQFVTLRVIDLVQARDASWQPVDPNMFTDSSGGYISDVHASCKDWLSIGRTEATVPNFDSTVETLEIRIPGNASGFYCAGLQVSLSPRPGVGGVTIRYDFIVPVCIVIEGRALTSDVKLLSSGLKFVEARDEEPASTSIVITLKNEGTARSKIAPSSSIWEVLPTKRRVIKRDVEFPPVAIIPGAEVDLVADLESSLPSGKYKIATRLSVDGLRVKGLTEEVSFINPTNSGAAHEIVPMRLTPTQVDLEMVPGRLATHKMTIRNDSDEAIVVKAVPVVPAALAGKVVQLRGEDLSCADWIEMRPNELPIRAGGERNVTVIVRMPKEEDLPVLALDPPNYYGTLKFYGFYRDRSSAGMASAMVNVQRKGAEVTPAIQQKNLQIHQVGQSQRFQVTGVFANVGLSHVVPTCTARIQSDGVVGSRIDYGVLKLVNEDADSVLMPYETRQFSGEVNFSNFPAGKYIVTVRLDYGPGLNTQIQKLYEVFDRNGEKLIFSATEDSGSVASIGG